MKAAYVGTLTPGSTSLMRAERLRALTPSTEWVWVDTDSVLIQSERIWQTAAYRLKAGKAVREINKVTQAALGSGAYDIVWVDKAIFLEPDTVEHLRKIARRLVHFTPDTAFANGRSRHFDKTLRLYDLVVTTKSFDVPEYLRLAGRDTVHLTTQGYDSDVHFPRNPDSERRDEVIFVGLGEPARERCLAALMENGITVRLAGRDWDGFVRRWGRKPNLFYEGPGMFGSAYATALSQSWIGLGLLSKRFAELHTTRTFEIPACGAILATEANAETTGFFDAGEALFFTDANDLASRIKLLLSTEPRENLSAMATRGRNRVVEDRRDNEHILSAVLADPRISL